ncbi:MAG: CapA family protein [Pseudomonadota bacterium]
MTTRLLPIFFLLPIAALAQVSGDDFAARVVSDAGRSLESVSATLDGVDLAVTTDGRFRLPRDGDRSRRLRVTADGHYAFVHTIAATDLRNGLFGTITLVEKKPGRRLLLFTGDAMLTRRFFNPPTGEHTLVQADTLESDVRRLLDPVRPYIGLADYASVNVETVLADTEPDGALPKSVNFVSPSRLATALADAGFDYAALGNNHTNDFSDAGIRATLDAIQSAGLDASGAGLDETSARRPAEVDIFGQPYAFLSYVGWPGYFTPSQAAAGDKGGAALGNVSVFSEDLRTVPSVATAVLQHHSGLEYAEQPPMSVFTELRHAVDAGADLVVAHHPHVLQGLELYRDKLIAYSMGNFLFDQTYPTTKLGMLLYVWMDGSRFHRAELVPIHINDYRPVPATGSLRYAVMHRLARVSAPLGTCFASSGMHLVLTPDVRCDAEALTVPADAGAIVSLRELGLTPLRPHYPAKLPGRYRLGTDILRSGEFDSSGQFGTRDRDWIRGRADTVEGSYRVRILPGAGRARVGMKGFQRAYTPSTPTTFSGRVRANGAASITFLLQRRTTRASTSEALERGPTEIVGELESVSEGWMPFRFHVDQPRVSTREVRLLFDIGNPDNNGVVLEFDDLSWVEWATPWLSGERPDSAAYATHVERE